MSLACTVMSSASTSCLSPFSRVWPWYNKVWMMRHGKRANATRYAMAYVADKKRGEYSLYATGSNW